jgi:tRNA-dihydrouridine synthase
LNKDAENPLILSVSNPWFFIDFDILKEKGIIKRIADNKYLWTKSKTSLAQYFDRSRGSTKIYTPGGFWAPIENIFLIKGKPIKRGSLRRFAGNNGNPLKPDESEDFKEIKKIVMEYREKIEKQKEEQKRLKNEFQSIEKIIKNAEKTGNIETLRAAREKIKNILV